MSKTIEVEIHDIAEIIKNISLEYGTQYGAALFLGVTQGHLSRLQSGIAKPSNEFLNRLGLKKVTIYVKKDVEL